MGDEGGGWWARVLCGHPLCLPAQHPFPHRPWQLPGFSLSNHPWPTRHDSMRLSIRVPSCPQAKQKSHDSSCTDRKLSLEFKSWAYVTGGWNLLRADSCSSQDPEETVIPSYCLHPCNCPGSSPFRSPVLPSLLPLCEQSSFPSNRFLACLS